MHQSAPLLTRFLKFAFYLLYQPLAWSYDLVAWVVSLGPWKSWVYSVLPEFSDGRVLELGFGPGHLQLAMRNKGIDAFGVDRSPQMHQLAQSKLRRANYDSFLVRADGRYLPFASKCFSQLAATFPTEYIFASQTLSEAKRVLQPAGKMIVLPVAWITARDPINRILAWLFRATKQSGEWTGVFSKTFRTAGFQVEEKRIELNGSALMLLIATKPGY